MYKNLATDSNIRDAAIDGSERASDLHMKLEYLRSQRHGERVVTVATATPIANSITEAYVMQRYLRPDLLAERRDRATSTPGRRRSGRPSREIEMAPTGGGRLPHEDALRALLKRPRDAAHVVTCSPT